MKRYEELSDSATLSEWDEYADGCWGGWPGLQVRRAPTGWQCVGSGLKYVSIATLRGLDEFKAYKFRRPVGQPGPEYHRTWEVRLCNSALGNIILSGTNPCLYASRNGRLSWLERQHCIWGRRVAYGFMRAVDVARSPKKYGYGWIW